MQQQSKINMQIYIGDYIDFKPEGLKSRMPPLVPEVNDRELNDEDLFKKILREFLII